MRVVGLGGRGLGSRGGGVGVTGLAGRPGGGLGFGPVCEGGTEEGEYGNECVGTHYCGR